MIRTNEDLQQTRAALAELEVALVSLQRRQRDMHPDRYALMAEPILDHMRQLQADLDAFLGFTAAGNTSVGRP